MSDQNNENRTMTRREFIKLSASVGTGAGAAWLLAGCAPAPTSTAVPVPSTATQPAATTVPATVAPTAIPKPVAEIKKLVMGTYNPNWGNNVTTELALSKGWFKEEGIEDKEIVIIDQSQIFPAVIGGSLMIAQQDTDLLAGANAAGEALYVISIYRDKEPWIFGVGPGYKTLADLKGKPLSGGAIGTRNESSLKEMVRRLGGNPDDYQWVPIGGGSDGRVKAVIGGVIAGTLMQDRHVPLIEKAGGAVLYNKREPFPQDAYIAHKNFLDKNPRTVIGFLKATFKARQYLQDPKKKDEIVALMKSRGYDFPQEFIDTYDSLLAIMSPTGTFDPNAMVNLISAAVKAGTLKKEVDWKTFVKLDYQNQAFVELGRQDLVMKV